MSSPRAAVHADGVSARAWCPARGGGGGALRGPAFRGARARLLQRRLREARAAGAGRAEAAVLASCTSCARTPATERAPPRASRAPQEPPGSRQ